MPPQVKRSSKDAVVALATVLLERHGFTAVSLQRNRMTLVKARSIDGALMTFWVKKDWAGLGALAAAVELNDSNTAKAADQSFADSVDATVAQAKAQGAEYLLLVHAVGEELQESSMVLRIDDVAHAYRQQLAGWPGRARNGGNAQLWFHETRKRSDASCVEVLHRFAVSLPAISGRQRSEPPDMGVKKVWAEVERRLLQDAFRDRVGDRFGWQCAVSGNSVREVLEAAHLPGKNWRQDNEATDGVMLRVDLHRLLDRELAYLRDGRFWIDERAMCDQYAAFDGKPYLRD